MKSLYFQAERFAWTPFKRTLTAADSDDSADSVGLADSEALPEDASGDVTEAVVAFLHVESKDEDADERKRVFKHTLKHIKWLANKRKLKNVVLHSFTHLGGENSSSGFAEEMLNELRERLESTGFTTRITPFGYTCRWELAVYGENVAKVWKEF